MTLPPTAGEPPARIRKALAVASASRLAAHEVVQPGPCALAHAALNDRRPAEQQAARPECLTRPAVEAELVAVLGDQPVLEAEARPDVVVNVPAGLRERVVGEPAGRTGVTVRLMLDELHRQVVGGAREHPPHRSRLPVAQVLEDGI